MENTNEVIDLTTSPLSPPFHQRRSSSNNNNKPKKIVKFTTSTSSNKIHFKIKKSSSHHHHHRSSSGHQSRSSSPSSTYAMDINNSDDSNNNHQVASHPWVPRNPYAHQIYNLSHIINQVHQPQLHGRHHHHQHALQPVHHHLANMYDKPPHVATPPSVLFFPQGNNLRDHWTLEEHEQFLMGLLKCGSEWTKIARYYVWKKTAQQVETYAINFFRHISSICLYNLRMKNNSSSSSCFANNPMMMNMMTTKHEVGPPPTLMLFPHAGREAHYQASGSTRTTNVMSITTTTNATPSNAFGDHLMMVNTMSTTTSVQVAGGVLTFVPTSKSQLDLELRLA